MKNPLLEVRSLSKSFPLKKNLWGKVLKSFPAVCEVSFNLEKGETLGIVGESGCGKSTLAKVILKLLSASEGDVFFQGQSLYSLSQEELRSKRRFLQMIFQDPYASLNPRMKVLDLLKEPLLVHKIGSDESRTALAYELLEKVGLSKSSAFQYPSNFSGGQRQRIAIARALILKPDLVIADEPVSALDVTIQASILQLFASFRKEFNFSCLFISHDLAVVEHVSDKVAVMYLGRFVEYGSREALFTNPKHPYTKALLESVPQAVYREGAQKKVYNFKALDTSEVPEAGCAFYPRCPLATTICQRERPVLKKSSETLHFHEVACHHAS